MKNERYVKKQEILDFNSFYHIYNRAIGNEKLFVTNNDYYFFIRKTERFLLPVVQIYAFCLIPNHFHFLVKTKDSSDIKKHNTLNFDKSSVDVLNKPFKNFFNSYSKSFNKAHNRMGRLFIQPYKRIKVKNEEYLKILINYIHRNPIHHGLVKNYNEWNYSSYNDCLSNVSTLINRKDVMSFFDTKDEFIRFHEENKTREEDIDYLLE